MSVIFPSGNESMTEGAFVGYRTLELFDARDGVTFPMMVFYPTDVPGKTERFGPYTLTVAMDAPPREGTSFPVLISHGSGGAPVLYRSLAYHLARCGFVVGAPEHPFNNRLDNSLAMKVENLTNRPRHLRIAADRLFDDESFACILKSDTFSIVGHSMGGYTALALAGGVPTPLACESPDNCSRRLAVEHDPRVRSLVLLAPATIWFREPGALGGVDVPILMLVGDRDELTPSEPHARIVLDGVSDRSKVWFGFVENAGHFSFLSPFPPSATKPEFPPSQDPPGFDRENFLLNLNLRVADFLTREA